MKNFLKNHPMLSKIISFLYRLLNFNIKKIKYGKNNKIIIKNCYLKKCKFIIHGENNIIEFGNLCQFNNSVFEIYGNNNKIIIGEKNYGKNTNIYLEDDDNEILIGNKCIFAGKLHIALTEGKKINIGNDCLFSSHIIFRTGDSHSILDMHDNKRINPAKDIILEDHVWVAYGVTILKGTYISKDSVVASNSVVTKKFKEQNIIIGGVPASIIKKNINWDRQRF